MFVGILFAAASLRWVSQLGSDVPRVWKVWALNQLSLVQLERASRLAALRRVLSNLRPQETASALAKTDRSGYRQM